MCILITTCINLYSDHNVYMWINIISITNLKSINICRVTNVKLWSSPSRLIWQNVTTPHVTNNIFDDVWCSGNMAMGYVKVVVRDLSSPKSNHISSSFLFVCAPAQISSTHVGWKWWKQKKINQIQLITSNYNGHIGMKTKVMKPRIATI